MVKINFYHGRDAAVAQAIMQVIQIEKRRAHVPYDSPPWTEILKSQWHSTFKTEFFLLLLQVSF